MNFLLNLVFVSFILTVSLPFIVLPSNAILIEKTHPGNFYDFQEHLTEVFDLGSGVFSAFIIIISLIAFIKLKTKRIIFISVAFMLFFMRAIFSIFDLIQPEMLELVLSILSFTGLVFFVISVFLIGNFKLRKTQ